MGAISWCGLSLTAQRKLKKRHRVCYFCQEKFDNSCKLKRRSLEHTVPYYLKGRNNVKQFVLSCQRCNTERGMFYEWYRRARDNNININGLTWFANETAKEFNSRFKKHFNASKTVENKIMMKEKEMEKLMWNLTKKKPDSKHYNSLNQRLKDMNDKLDQLKETK